MFGSTSTPPSDTNANISSSESRFSLIELRRIHTQLKENKSVNDDNKNLVVEILRIIAEMVVYGDNKSELLFDFFCEKNMLSLFLEIMWTEGGCPSIVHIQILQTLSILINCVRNDTSLYYLLSNNYINEIIIYPFAFESDENLCDQFASFMKSLSLKLNVQTVQFFFIEETGAFPILTRAIGLLDVSSEPMVRISSQSTILNVYKVDDLRAREYALQEEVMRSLFTNIVKLMKSQHGSIAAVCLAYLAEGDETRQAKLETQLEDVLASTEDWFYYLQDLLDLKILVLRQALVHHLLCEFVYPVLLRAVLDHSSGAVEGDAAAPAVPEGSKNASSGNSGNSVGRSEEHVSDLVARSMEIEFSVGDDDGQSGSGGNGSRSNAHAKALLASVANGDCSSPAEKAAQSRAIAMNAALMYLLQMLRFMTDPLVQRAALVVLYHPLSRDARKTVVDATMASVAAAATPANQNTSTAESLTVPSDSSADTTAGAADTAGVVVSIPSLEQPSSITASPSVVPANSSLSLNAAEYERNAVLETLVAVVSGASPAAAIDNATSKRCSQKLILTTVYLFHLLCAGLIAGNPSRTVDGDSYFAADLMTPIQMIRLLQCLEILPSARGPDHTDYNKCCEVKVVDTDGVSAQNQGGSSGGGESGAARRNSKNDRHRLNKHCSRKLQWANQASFEADPDLLSLATINRMTNLTAAAAADDIDQVPAPLLATYMGILRSPAGHSLTALQVVVHSVFMIGNLMHSAFVDASAPVKKNHGLPMFAWLLTEIRAAARSAAQTLALRTEGPQSEVLLNLVREETRRYEGKKWKTTVFRMYGDILLFLPWTAGNLRRLGIDFDLPISQVECVRKEIQTFLVLRALHRHIHGLSQLAKLPPIVPPAVAPDLCASIRDKDLLCLEESNLLPPTVADGLSYDMRGKRFLDALLIHSGATAQQGPHSGRSASPSGSGSSSIWAASASILTLGYLGGGSGTKKASSSSSSSSSGSSTPPRPTSKRGSAVTTDGKSTAAAPAHQSILFIQDAATLLLISQDKTNNKIGFKVFAAVPLLYVDAKVDPEDRRRFRVLVRSWRPLPQMCKVEPDGADGSGEDTLTATNNAPNNFTRTRRGSQSEGYRKSSETSTFWSLTLAMETEQACMLAVQHIEKKRRDIFAQKMANLRGMLQAWMADGRVTESVVESVA